MSGPYTLQVGSMIICALLGMCTCVFLKGGLQVYMQYKRLKEK